MENENEIYCPYCGEANSIEIDLSEGSSQNFVRDCEVCCRPIELSIHIGREGEINMEVRTEEGF
ncbi:MAG: CPXCG motif-containing cysteine-rich protein [Ignavibacteria bacterium]